MKRISWFLLAFALLGSGCGGAERGEVIKLGHGLDPTHPVHRAMEYLGQRLAETSGGTMRVEIYPSQQLGTEREALELLQIGSLGMTKVSSSVLEGFVPSFQILGLPYLFLTHPWICLNCNHLFNPPPRPPVKEEDEDGEDEDDDAAAPK